jgi:hypothetical protein
MFKFKNKNFNKGFVMLFSVVISSMLLAIALGVSNISIKQFNFSTSLREANKAFFAADVGTECALYFDSMTPSAYGNLTPPLATECAGNFVDVSGNNVTWVFALTNLGADGRSCANVSFSRFNNPPFVRIVSSGYSANADNTNNSCLPSSMSLERELRVNY